MNHSLATSGGTITTTHKNRRQQNKETRKTNAKENGKKNKNKKKNITDLQCALQVRRHLRVRGVAPDTVQHGHQALDHRLAAGSVATG